MPEDVKLPWNPENLKSVILKLLQQAAHPGQEELRARMLNPKTAKEELAKFIETPADWDQRVFAFEESGDRDDTRFFVGVLPKVGDTTRLLDLGVCSGNSTHLPP